MGLEEEMKKMEGVILQIPPAYSAIKLEGKKLYQYAREGKEIDLSFKAKKVYIKEFNLLDMKENMFSFRAKVSGGTYVRTLCHDVGETLGVGGTMTSLRRTKIGEISVDSALEGNRLKEMSSEEILLRSIEIDALLNDFCKVTLKGNWEEKLFSNGVVLEESQYQIEDSPDNQRVEFPLELPEEYGRLYRTYSNEGRFFGMGILKEEGFKAHKVFKE